MVNSKSINTYGTNVDIMGIRRNKQVLFSCFFYKFVFITIINCLYLQIKQL